MLRFASMLTAAVILLAARGCGGGSGQKVEGEPCTRSNECAEGLDCRGGVCRGPRDAASNEDSGGDAS